MNRTSPLPPKLRRQGWGALPSRLALVEIDNGQNLATDFLWPPAWKSPNGFRRMGFRSPAS
ncbi:hypothetical protein Sinac_0080 [Singulisphaera acidiphila DSM 18658]|uniref:Uncharacterized protein n=1 Tax=Singulisphaera acidiphila (strain ATCC BAA-1392 / DSM 18658 / VKM B-2454 / MOB10) TaxID=886293 RepID=L0D7D5_SINAD|nr:hypothetical protein Sinac_0080 [Singulisphaera acidiphila DSM 18658]